MKYFKKLIGERIYLSPMNVDDLEIYTKWMNDFAVTDGIHQSSQLISLSSEKDFLENKKNSYQFAIVDKNTDKLIGNCGLDKIDHIDRIAEIGIFIGEEEYRNNGYGTEAIKLLLDYGFNYLNLNNIMLRVFSFNERAINCYKKVGFKEIGKRRKCIYTNGKYYDEIYMDILNDEYK